MFLPITIPSHISAVWPDIFRQHACDRHDVWQNIFKNRRKGVTPLLAVVWKDIATTALWKEGRGSHVFRDFSKGHSNSRSGHKLGQIKSPRFKFGFIHSWVTKVCRLCSGAAGVLINDFHLNGWMSANKKVKIMIFYDNLNIRELSEVSLEAGPSSCRDMRVFMFTCGWLSRFRERMNQDDRAFGQQLLRVVLANPQLQNALGLDYSILTSSHPMNEMQLKQSAREQSLLSCRMKLSKVGASNRLHVHLSKTRFYWNL